MITLSDKSEFIVERLTPTLENEWQEFIDASANGTVFHTQKFFAYHSPDRFRQHHLIIRMRNKIRAVFTSAEIDTPEGKILHSHPGASYGGIVIREGADFHDCDCVVKALLDYTRAQEFKSIRLTQTPLIYYKTPHQSIEFALQRHGFTVECCELTQSTDLTALPENPVDALVDKTRNAYRQSEKKDCVYIENAALTPDNLAVFHELLTENRRHLGVKPTHSLEELIRLSKLIPEKLHLAFVEYNSEMIAGLLHFICNEKVVILFYVCHNREKQSLKPAPYILANTLRWAKNAGFHELDFGISTVRGQPNRGLLKFKENFRTRSFLRNTYYIKL